MIAEEEQKKTEVQPKSSSQPEKKRRTQPVVIYLIILTVVVVGMLILSYAMQRRNTQHLEDLNETVTGIQNSYDTMVTINDLQAEINTLHSQISQYEDEIEDYEDQIEDLQTQLKQAQTDADTLASVTSDNEQLSKRLTALEYLLLLEQYYQAEDYEICATIIDTMESYSYDDVLSDYEWTSSIVEGNSSSELYTEISEAVQAETNAEK